MSGHASVTRLAFQPDVCVWQSYSLLKDLLTPFFLVKSFGAIATTSRTWKTIHRERERLAQVSMCSCLVQSM